LAVAATATPLLTSAGAEGASQAGADPLNGNGFYRFKLAYPVVTHTPNM
jgi:hypothetical protein